VPPIPQRDSPSLEETIAQPYIKPIMLYNVHIQFMEIRVYPAPEFVVVDPRLFTPNWLQEPLLCYLSK